MYIDPVDKVPSVLSVSETLTRAEDASSFSIFHPLFFPSVPILVMLAKNDNIFPLVPGTL